MLVSFECKHNLHADVFTHGNAPVLSVICCTAITMLSSFDVSYDTTSIAFGCSFCKSLNFVTFGFPKMSFLVCAHVAPFFYLSLSLFFSRCFSLSPFFSLCLSPSVSLSLSLSLSFLSLCLSPSFFFPLFLSPFFSLCLSPSFFFPLFLSPFFSLFSLSPVAYFGHHGNMDHTDAEHSHWLHSWQVWLSWSTRSQCAHVCKLMSTVT